MRRTDIEDRREVAVPHHDNDLTMIMTRVTVDHIGDIADDDVHTAVRHKRTSKAWSRVTGYKTLSYGRTSQPQAITTLVCRRQKI